MWKVKSKEIWLNATKNNCITWSLNQTGQKRAVSFQHQSYVILSAQSAPWCLSCQLLIKPTLKTPPLPSGPKPGWHRRGSTAPGSRMQPQTLGICRNYFARRTLRMTEQSSADVSLWGTVSPNGDPAPAPTLSSCCSQTLAKLQPSLVVPHFSKSAALITERIVSTVWGSTARLTRFADWH